MKKLYLIWLACAIVSCHPRIKNDQETLEKIFAMHRFDIEFHTQGSFGNGKERLTLTKKNDHYVLKSVSTGKEHRIETSTVDSLSNFLKPRIGKFLGGGCTIQSSVRVGTYWNSVDYHHSYCGGIEVTTLSDLLGFDELLYQEDLLPQPDVIEEGTLEALLEEEKQRFLAEADSTRIANYEAGIKAVEKSGVAQAAVGAGDRVIDFTLADQNGDSVNLKTLLRNGPVVITWYRGGWCPYCNITLSFLQEKLPEIKAAGGQLVAITPELPDSSISTSERHGLGFPILWDVGNTVARKYGLVFKLTDAVAEHYQQGFDLHAYNDDDSDELPLAATYVVDHRGKIHYSVVCEDYRKRAEPNHIIGMLRNIRSYSQ